MKCQPVLFYAAMLASLRAGSRQKASDVNLTGRVDISIPVLLAAFRSQQNLQQRRGSN